MYLFEWVKGNPKRHQPPEGIRKIEKHPIGFPGRRSTSARFTRRYHPGPQVLVEIQAEYGLLDSCIGFTWVKVIKAG